MRVWYNAKVFYFKSPLLAEVAKLLLSIIGFYLLIHALDFLVTNNHLLSRTEHTVYCLALITGLLVMQHFALKRPTK